LKNETMGTKKEHVLRRVHVMSKYPARHRSWLARAYEPKWRLLILVGFTDYAPVIGVHLCVYLYKKYITKATHSVCHNSI